MKDPLAEYEYLVSRTHERPKVVYLGRKEHAKLCEEAKRFIQVPNPNKKGEPRLKWMDMEVYEVDAETHVGFGSIPPSPCG